MNYQWARHGKSIKIEKERENELLFLCKFQQQIITKNHYCWINYKQGNDKTA